MYAGRMVESAPRHDVFARTRHPYTAGLLASVPRLDQPKGEPLHPIKGSPRDTIPWVEGCAFAPRCPNVLTGCRGTPPALAPDGNEWWHLVRCINPVGAPTQEAATT